MSENDNARRSITATVDEYVQGHDQLQIPVDPDEFCEMWEILQRIEQRLSEAKANAWRERWTT